MYDVPIERPKCLANINFNSSINDKVTFGNNLPSKLKRLNTSNDLGGGVTQQMLLEAHNLQNHANEK